MRLLFYFIFFIHFLVIPTESEVQEIKQCSCQVCLVQVQTCWGMAVLRLTVYLNYRTGRTEHQTYISSGTEHTTSNTSQTACTSCMFIYIYIYIYYSSRISTNKNNCIRRKSSPTNKKFCSSGIVPTNKNHFIRRESRRIKIILFIGNRQK